MRRHAVDMIVDSGLLDGLDEGERLAYIELATDRLAEGLATFLNWWTMNDSPPVDQARGNARCCGELGVAPDSRMGAE